MTQYNIRLSNKNNQSNITPLSHISLYTTVLVFLDSDQFRERKYMSKKKNLKYNIDIDYNEENKSIQSTKEVCCS